MNNFGVLLGIYKGPWLGSPKDPVGYWDKILLDFIDEGLIERVGRYVRLTGKGNELVEHELALRALAE
jgi:predicted methyltransferase